MRRSKRQCKETACNGLLDHLVGAGEQGRRDFDAERSRGRKVDHEFELARLDDRQISWLGALEDSDGIDATWRNASMRLVP